MDQWTVQLGQYPPARQVIAHLSEPHLLAGGAPLHGAAETVDNLRRALTQLERSGRRIDALVFTGDLTDLGEPDAYQRLRDLVEPFAERMGAQLIWVMGNHDERPEYARILMREEPSDEPQDRVVDLDGLRLIVLDTSVPGYHHGELSTSQLEWLADELSRPAPRGTLLALHHPPVPVIIEAMATLELLDQHRLEAVVRGTDVRGILGGHLHYATTSTFAGVPVSVASASCYTLSLTARDRLLSGLNGGQAFNLVHVYDDRIVHSVVPIGEFEEISGLDADELPGIVAMTPQERREQLSAKQSFANLGDEPGS
jgi:3',5'-cyclic-AMP phosphodiesterase